MREILTSTRDYYVSPSGDNSNDGLTSETPFLQPSFALRFVRDELDLHGFGVTVNLADGLYSDAVLLQSRWVGDGSVTLKGNGPSVCQFVVPNNAIALTDGARLSVDGMKLSTTIGSCLFVSYGAVVKFSNLEFGSAAVSHVDAGEGSIAVATGNYKISGGGVSHMHGHGNCRLIAVNRVVDILNPVTFSAYFLGLANSSAAMQGMTFNGKSNVTGKPHYVHYNSTLLTMSSAPLTYLPGNQTGFVDAATFGCVV